jgi:hypothetical protein
MGTFLHLFSNPWKNPLKQYIKLRKEVMFTRKIDPPCARVHKGSMTHPFNRISREKAREIAAARACHLAPSELDCYEQKPDGVSTYNGPPDELPCWWIPINYGDQVGAGGIQAICQQTGKILYDGSDGME